MLVPVKSPYATLVNNTKAGHTQAIFVMRFYRTILSCDKKSSLWVTTKLCHFHARFSRARHQTCLICCDKIAGMLPCGCSIALLTTKWESCCPRAWNFCMMIRQ